MSTVTTHVSEQVGNLSIAELESLIRFFPLSCGKRR